MHTKLPNYEFARLWIQRRHSKSIEGFPYRKVKDYAYVSKQQQQCIEVYNFEVPSEVKVIVFEGLCPKGCVQKQPFSSATW